MDAFLTLLKEIWPSLERFLVGFVSYLNGYASEKNKMILRGLQTRLKANEVLKEEKDASKKLSDAELANNTVID